MKQHQRLKRQRRDTSKFTLRLLILAFMFLVLPITLWANTNFQKIFSRAIASASKLGVFVTWADADAIKISQSGARIIVVIDPQLDVNKMNLVKDYKRKNPNGIAVMRVYQNSQGRKYSLSDNPDIRADEYWTLVLKPAVDSMSTTDRQIFDYLSGPNEFENIPDLLRTYQEGEWAGKFWARLATLVKNAGFLPNMGDISVANLYPQALSALVPYLRQIKALGGAWSYHAYSNTLAQETRTDWAFRYRTFYDYFSTNAPDLLSMPLLLSEAGFATGTYGGYKSTGNTQGYKLWLSWFDSEIKKDNYVQGAAIFQAGDGGQWDTFRIDLISDWLANHIRGTQPTTTAPAIVPLTSTPSPSYTFFPTAVKIPSSAPEDELENTYLTFPKENDFTPRPASAPKLDIRRMLGRLVSWWKNFIPAFIRFTQTVQP